jgi:hypothetical protein
VQRVNNFKIGSAYVRNLRAGSANCRKDGSFTDTVHRCTETAYLSDSVLWERDPAGSRGIHIIPQRSEEGSEGLNRMPCEQHRQLVRSRALARLAENTRCVLCDRLQRVELKGKDAAIGGGDAIGWLDAQANEKKAQGCKGDNVTARRGGEPRG